MRMGKWLGLGAGGLWLLSPLVAAAGALYVPDASGGLAQPALPDKTVVLTFDDGPSAYTPQILAVLHKKGVPATFFVVGKEALRNNGLVQQIYDSGNEVGNHTFSHVDLAELPDWHLQLELGLNRLIIESQIGHSTRLFRPPYLGSDSLTLNARDLIERVSRYGYVTAGEDIDSEDWRRPGVAQIVQNATTGQVGGVILLHDGGGDRTQTVQALPAIIDYYQARGYHFTTLSGALGLTRDQLMPGLSRGDAVLSAMAAGVFGGYALASRWLYWAIVGLIVASFARMGLVVVAALVQARRRKQRLAGTDEAKVPVSVLVPAYNEAAVIRTCLASVLASDYRAFEVIVVDDGSRDDTAALAAGLGDRRLRVVRQANGGKAAALNRGIGLARAGVVVAIDADTVFQPDTLRRLARHFGDPRVGAVSGNTRVANQHRLLTKLQSLEYVVGFNLDRRMGDLFDCITVVPGAIGAFRKSVLLE
ncbi:MAG TPA: glycosyltransferase, partial [Candidatus Saccharimonas sp.]|nr:glycosyltransferase [Candidatus Saccharimonas sp.]